MRFNTQNSSEINKTLNLAGATAFKQSAEVELINILLTSFITDTFYQSSNDKLTQLIKAIHAVSPEFAAKAAVYARTEFGMRTVSHVVAGELCKTTNQPWMKDFLNAIIYRPDDILEISAYYDIKNNPIRACMKKGFGKALSRFNEYELAKYRAPTKSLNLVDCVNLFHPKATPALTKLVKGELKNTETWEAKISNTGKAETKEAQLEQKAEVWKDMLEKNTLGYFALLRNLRNIIQQAPSCIDLAIERLTNEEVIKKSLVLPFRYLTALSALKELGSSTEARMAAAGIHHAIDTALGNCPELPGSTLVAVDGSGSMGGKPFEIASMFASALYLRNNGADLMLFDYTARYVIPDSDRIAALCGELARMFQAGGTNFNSIFTTASAAKKKYDRIIIISDMQAWVQNHTLSDELKAYKRITGADPYIYSFDVIGSGSMQFPERNVITIGGFSEKVFDVMAQCEQDKNALVNTVKKVSLVYQDKKKKEV